MQLDRKLCYQALQSRDARFDGMFFIAVKTTKIYCRPICPTKPPKLENIVFYPNAASAEKNGFRPCLRCRPELAPGNAKCDAIGRTAATIAHMIEDGALNHMSVTELADELGITSRHLRRVTETTCGVSPLALAQTQRLLLAKRLLADSNLPITEIVFASGFASVRRFNAVLKEQYGLTPSQIRRGRQHFDDDVIVSQLSYRPPFDWQALLRFLEDRATGGVESIVDDQYMRTVQIGSATGWVNVSNLPERNVLKVEISASLARELMPLLGRIKRLFDLNADPQVISRHLGALAANHPGLRRPGSFDGFETSVRAILGQQVSVKAATTLMRRLCQKFGEKIDTPYPELNILSPTAERVAGLSPVDLVSLGMINTRAQSIISLAQAVSSGEVSLNQTIDPELSIVQLKMLPGIGDWTAHYIAMRVLDWPDAFPHQDLGIIKALKIKDGKQLKMLAESWRPWRSYAAMHLWKQLEVS